MSLKRTRSANSLACSSDPEALAGIITRAQERAKILIRFNRTARYLSEDELLSDVNWKLLRVVDKFDPSKGSAFTFLSQAISTSLCTSVSNARKSANRYSELDENITNTLIKLILDGSPDAVPLFESSISDLS